MRVSIAIFGLALAAAAAPGLAQAEQIVGLTNSNNLVFFDSATPGTTSAKPINGLGSSVLTGIDLRPATHDLYSVATDGNVFVIKVAPGGASYDATLVGNIGSPPLTGTSYGIDFNPTVDRLRLISDDDLNLRINPNTGLLAVNDTAIGGGLDLVGSAYTNSFAGALATVLYGLDAAGDQLVRATMPNAGAYSSVGPLGIDLTTSDPVGFDISGDTGVAYFNDGGQFYTVNLATGAATLTGAVGSGPLVGLTVSTAIPEPGAWALMISGFATVGAFMRRRRESHA